MRKQYAVFGLGNFGKHLALGLENLGCEVIVWTIPWKKFRKSQTRYHMQCAPY